MDQVKRIKEYAGTAPNDASSTNENASCPASGGAARHDSLYDHVGRLERTTSLVSYDLMIGDGKIRMDIKESRKYADPDTGQRVVGGNTVFNQNNWFFTGTLGGQDIDKVFDQKTRELNGFGNL